MISQQTIDTVRDTLVKEFNPVEIYLFGSYAWGNPDSESDLDLLIIVDSAEEDRIKMLVRGHRVLNDFDIAKDLLVYTKREFDEWSQEIPRLSYKIKKRGKQIYVRHNY